MTKNSTSEWLERVAAQTTAMFDRLSQPSRLAQVQTVVLAVLLVWGAGSAARLLWALWPTPAAPLLSAPVINPVSARMVDTNQVSVNLDGMLDLGLFGDPVNEAAVEAEVATAESNPREGIEDGARETRLDLRLTGIVSSSEDGLGTAVIEAKKEQLAYSVGDTLPASGKVTLAKVMPTQVVLSNNGTYELLRLFEGNDLSAALATKSSALPTTPATTPAAEPPARRQSTSTVEIRDPSTARLASSYREQLYNNPQSLAEVVKVSAVRGPDGLKGYRVSPGSDAAQFKQLGFKSGDIVTAVNGLALSDPTNTMRLYQLMREASDATFDVERGDTVVTIAVSLNQ